MEPYSSEEPYNLHVECVEVEVHGKNAVHHPLFYCCEVHEYVFPVPPPPRVHHPTIGTGLLDRCEADSVMYEFMVQGKMELVECFTK